MEYKASLDTLAKIITIFVLLLFPFIIWTNWNLISSVPGSVTFILIHTLPTILFIAAIAIGYIYSTKKYIIRNGDLVIVRPVKEKRILISDIEEARLVEKGEMFGTIRTFGVGGMFGYFGKYYNSAFGSITLYTTQKKNRIFIRTKQGNKIIISPDDVSLLEHLKKG